MNLYRNEDKRAALDFANDIRTYFDMRPRWYLRTGMRNDGLLCPIARTINGNHRVDVSEILTLVDGHKFWTPPKVRRFIARFDNGTDHSELSIG